MKFCAEFEQLHGKEAVTPNLHMHMHLNDCILDAEPVYTFWCFSFERYNGMVLGTIYSCVHAVEGDGGKKFWVDLLALRTLVYVFRMPAHICVNPILVDVRLIKLMNYE